MPEARVVTEKVLLTGRPGCGKTTLIKRVVNILGRRAGGFTLRKSATVARAPDSSS